MYHLFRTKEFEKSLLALLRSGKFQRQEIEEVLDILSSGTPLPPSYRDHALKGDMSNLRECHVRGDILLIYRKDREALILVALDIGTHHEIFGK